VRLAPVPVPGVDQWVALARPRPAGRDGEPTPNEGATMDYKLEVAVIPVADVDRAKEFYKSLGWREDADFPIGPTFRVVQYTPPGSSASIHFGSGVTSSPPGTGNAFLIVTDIVAARAELVDAGVDVSEIFHFGSEHERLDGPDEQRTTYSSYATFSDPDGNQWTLQEITSRLPGR
jgi:catechol 2,3-dioxygenase-like lactoylglutathione lyase family enzyme